MKTVEDVLQAKGRGIWFIKPDASVYEAVQLMAEKDSGAVVVLDEAGHLVGMFTERDYLRRVALEERSPKALPVKEVMTTRVHYVSPKETVDECMALMADKRIRHLPVFENDHLVGMISARDVLRAAVVEKDLMIDQLEDYIKGPEAYF